MPASCFHEKPGSIRKFKRGRIVFFGIQCPDCLKLVGPKLKPDEPEGLIHPKDVPLAEVKRPFQGEGNSKRKKYAAYLRSAAWKRRQSDVLERDDHTCRHCGGIANGADHLTYENFGHEPLEDLVASCNDCNQQARQDRIGGMT